jgi:hypothetical protein
MDCEHYLKGELYEPAQTGSKLLVFLWKVGGTFHLFIPLNSAAYLIQRLT